jgi:hypothetical protein
VYDCTNGVPARGDHCFKNGAMQMCVCVTDFCNGSPRNVISLPGPASEGNLTLHDNETSIARKSSNTKNNDSDVQLTMHRQSGVNMTSHKFSIITSQRTDERSARSHNTSSDVINMGNGSHSDRGRGSAAVITVGNAPHTDNSDVINADNASHSDVINADNASHSDVKTSLPIPPPSLKRQNSTDNTNEGRDNKKDIRAAEIHVLSAASCAHIKQGIFAKSCSQVIIAILLCLFLQM